METMKSVVKAIRNLALIAWRKYYWWNRRRVASAANRRTIEQALRSGKPFKLEVASPRRAGRDDWVFSDLGGNGDLCLDLTKPLPIPSDSVDYLYSSHFLEHLSYPEPMLSFLKECVRILKPSGVFGIAVPNAEIFLRAYLSDSPFNIEKYLSWPVGLRYSSKINYVNFVAYLGGEHKHMFDGENLCEVLREAGFQHVKRREFDIDIDLEVRRHESIYAVGSK